jgi:hypothetical protein
MIHYIFFNCLYHKGITILVVLKQLEYFINIVEMGQCLLDKMEVFVYLLNFLLLHHCEDLFITCFICGALTGTLHKLGSG